MADLISRDAAIREMHRLEQDDIETYGAKIPEGFDAEPAVEALKALPSAQPERKTGRWQYVDYGGFGNWHCTACRKICICNGDFDFCPNCGAKMEEGDG